MSAPWTPGPWRLDPEANDEAVIGSRGFMVADCCIFSARKGAPTDAENRANARLIAAAPDLAEALQKLTHAAAGCCNTAPSDYDQEQTRRAIVLGLAALSKARGETP